MSLKRLNKVFIVKRKKLPMPNLCTSYEWDLSMLMEIKHYVHIPSITYEWNAKIRLWKRKPYEHISCIPYEWDLNETWNVCALCISYEWNAKKSMIMKSDSLMCTLCEWGFMYSLNGMLSSYVYEKESFCAQPRCLLKCLTTS